MRRRITLAEWCEIVCRGVWPYAPTAGKGDGAGSPSLVKSLEFLLDRVGFQREKPILDHHFLPFFTIDKLDEFTDDRIQWFIGYLIDIEIQVPPERIRSIVCGLLAGLFERRALFLSQRNSAHI